MASTTHFPLIYVSGGPRECGRSHGRQCADRIAATVRYYRDRIALPARELDRIALAYLAALADAAPDLREEIRGISEGSGASETDIGLLNARSEIISGSECTSVSFPSSRVLGQTWDWSSRLADLAMLLHVTRHDGLRLLMLVEPGMLGKIGLNSAGVGICLNFLKSPGPLAVGVPLHALSRLALEAGTTEGAVDIIRKNAGGCAGHLLVGDAGGHAASIELAGPTVDVATSAMNDLCHTNHYLRLPSVSRGLIKDIDTRRRYARLLGHLVDCAPAESSLQIVLQDRGGLFPICRARGLPFVKDPSTTIAVLTMNLARRTLSIKRGTSPAPFGVHGV
jgi:isopenicillin-N N-acyltransferase-like protein